MIKTIIAATLLTNLLPILPVTTIANPTQIALSTPAYTSTLIETKQIVVHNPIFDKFIDDRETLGYTHIRDTFTDDFINNLIETCEEINIDPWLVLAVMDAESAYDPNAKAYDGSKHYGLMQLSVYYFSDEMEEEGTDDFFDPIANSTVGAKEIGRLIEQMKKYRCVKSSNFTNPIETLAIYSYHVGEANAVPNFKEGTVDDYTLKVIKNWQAFKTEYEKQTVK